MGCCESKPEVSNDPWDLASRGYAQQLERWLELGGNPSALDRQGGRGTLLHAAAHYDQVACIKVLLRAGADVNAVTKLRGSPLHAAADHSSGLAVQALLDGGADPLLKNAEGRSAIDVAVANGFASSAEIMRSAAARQAARRRSEQYHPDGNGGPGPRQSPYGGGMVGQQGQQYQQQQRPQQQQQQRISGQFGYPEWQAKVGTSWGAEAVQPGRRGLPSELASVYQPGHQAQQAQQGLVVERSRPSADDGRRSNQAPSGSPHGYGGDAAAVMSMKSSAPPRPSPFEQAAAPLPAGIGTGGSSAPPQPGTPPHGGSGQSSPGGLTPTQSAVLAGAGHSGQGRPSSTDQLLAQFRAKTSGQGSAGSSELGSGQSASQALPAGVNVSPQLMRNAGGVPSWWQQAGGGAAPSGGAAAGPGHSPRGVFSPAAPSIPEGAAMAGAGGSGQQPQEENVRTGGSSNSSGGSSLLVTDPLLQWVNTHLKSKPDGYSPQGAPNAGTGTLPATGSGGSAGSGGGATVAAGGAASAQMQPSGSTMYTQQSSMMSGALSHARSAMVDIKPWEISYDDLMIQRPIGEGSFGKVYLAKWNETLVAVKLLLSLQDIQKVAGPEAALTLSSPVLFNLQKECSLMAGMRHPNIVQFMGVSAMPPAMITEYCGKGSLTDVLRGAASNPKQAALLTWARRLNLALDAAKGMLYLHRKGIIHRDLKSPNLLVDSTWRVKIADFNLSKIIDVDGQNAKTGTMAGANPKWLAPEVIAGQPSKEGGDVFSFGVVLWELLTWSIPWQKQSPWTVVAQVLGGKRLPMPALDPAKLPGSPADNAAFAPQLPAYAELIKRCWGQDPEDRPDFEEIIRELRKFCEAAMARGPPPAQ